MKKKVLIMLAMMLTVGSLAACSKQEEEPAPEPTVVEEEPTPEPAEETRWKRWCRKTRIC